MFVCCLYCPNTQSQQPFLSAKIKTLFRYNSVVADEDGTENCLNTGRIFVCRVIGGASMLWLFIFVGGNRSVDFIIFFLFTLLGQALWFCMLLIAFLSLFFVHYIFSHAINSTSQFSNNTNNFFNFILSKMINFVLFL